MITTRGVFLFSASVVGEIPPAQEPHPDRVEPTRRHRREQPARARLPALSDPSSAATASSIRMTRRALVMLP